MNKYEEQLNILKQKQIQFPGRLAVILKKAPKAKRDNLDGLIYLVQSERILVQFLIYVRKRNGLEPPENLFFFVNNAERCYCKSMVKDLHKEHADSDGILHLTYSEQDSLDTQ